MMIRSTWLVAMLLCVSVPAQACVITIQEKHNMFVNFDRNRDGKLDVTEYISGESNRFGLASVDPVALHARFQMMDRLQKGRITVESFQPIPDKRCMKETQMSY